MNRNGIQVLDMTKLFTKEILLYSLFDIHFKKPVRLMYGVYFVLLFLLWSVPILYFFWPVNVYGLMIALSVPAFGASAMSKPIWGGKPFSSWLSCQIKYVLDPKFYYDTLAGKSLENIVYKIDNKYSVSRSMDYLKLYKLQKSKGGGS